MTPITDKLVEAAQVVIDRWDSPLWKDLPHTGEFINRLREALAAYASQQAEPSEQTRFGAGDAVRIYEIAKAVFHGCGQEARDVIEWYHSSLLVEAGVTAAPPKQAEPSSGSSNQAPGLCSGSSEPSEARVEAAAKALADVSDSGWLSLEEQHKNDYRSEARAVLQAADAVSAPGGPPTGYESTTPAYIRWVSPERYAQFKPEIQKWYRPYWLAADAVSAGVAVPEGMRLVPVEPTPEMSIRGGEAFFDATGPEGDDGHTQNDQWHAEAIWAAMLAAAPGSEQKEGAS